MKALMMPSMATLRKVLLTNQVQNCPVTDKDCQTAIEICGQDRATLHGETTRSSQTAAVDNTVAIPKRSLCLHKNVHVCVDNFHVNGMPFLTSISKTLMCRTVANLKDEKTLTLCQALDAIFKRCNDAGCKVRHLSLDNQCKPALDPIKDQLGLTVHCAAAQEHVPQAERNVRTFKDRIRSAIAAVPFVCLPDLLVTAIVMEVGTKLNFFVNENGIPNCAPRQLLKDLQVDCHRHCSIPILSHVASPHEGTPHNDVTPRALDCLHLRPLCALHGGHQLCHLPTGRTVTRHGRLTVLPMPQAVIDLVNQQGQKQNNHGLKIESKCFPTWTAAVSGMQLEQQQDDQSPDAQEAEDHESDSDEEDDDDETPNMTQETESETDSEQEETEIEQDSEQDETNEDMGVNTPNDNGHEDTVVSQRPADLEEEMSVPQEDNFQDTIEEDDHDIPSTNSTEEPDRQVHTETQVSQENASSEDQSQQEEVLGSADIEDDRGCTVRRSARMTQFTQELDLDEDESIAMARTMSLFHMQSAIKCAKDEFAGFNTKFGKAVKAVCFLQNYSLKAGIKKFGTDGEDAARAEMKQLND